VLEKLAAIEAKYEQLSAELATPAVQADNAKFRSHSKAIAEMQRSELVREALGEHLFEWFIANKRAEWNEHRSYVTGLELERNLPRL